MLTMSAGVGHWMISAIALLLSSLTMAFEPPGSETRREAAGDLKELSIPLQRAFAPDAAGFDPIPTPQPNDWLAVQAEPGQTFDQFKTSRPNRPGQSRHIIYL